MDVLHNIAAVYGIEVSGQRFLPSGIYGRRTSSVGPSPRQRHLSIAVSAAAGLEQRRADFIFKNNSNSAG